jgi:hypothetical protein
MALAMVLWEQLVVWWCWLGPFPHPIIGCLRCVVFFLEQGEGRRQPQIVVAAVEAEGASGVQIPERGVLPSHPSGTL